MTGGTHRISIAEFDALASGDGGATGALRAAEGSLRLVLLRTVVDTARRLRPLDLTESGAETAFDLIAELHRAHLATITTLLLHPPLGTWGMLCLRRLGAAGAGDGDDAAGTGTGTGRGAPSLAVDLGYLGGMAASAAVRVGACFEVRVPARAGLVHLPGLGAAAVGRDGWYVIRGGPAGATVDGPGLDGERPIQAGSADARWLPVRRLRTAADGLEIDLALDDLDPYRGFGGLPSHPRLDEATAARWEHFLAQAWRQLVCHHRPRAEVIRELVTSVVPLRFGPTGQETSGTSGHAFGAMASTTPVSGPALALALVHEAQHGKLAALSHLVNLVDGPSPATCYAPWRPDPRPVGNLLQGCYAYLGIVDYWRMRRITLRDIDADRALCRHADFEFARWRRAVWTAMDTVAGSGRLTALGERFVAGMRARLRPMLDEPVRPWVECLADDVAASHRAGWQLRNVRPDEAAIELAARAWRAGAPCPRDMPRGRVTPTAEREVDDVRLELAYQRIRDPDGFEKQASEPARLAAAAAAVASSGDVLLIAGRHAEAAVRYAAEIREDGSAGAWEGLAVVSGRLDEAAPLHRCPAQLAALHAEIRRTPSRPNLVAPNPDAPNPAAPNPVTLAHWIAW
ncbi:HEXXH motif domain-containing protein [Pseudofrankia saprophytica]|uniref:HEXXH motif domain-containing protein n=1 Tax=Pseudofrankia saprophytica TaxID=298655 RepID=UPI000234CB97|nr:HEXXH motif domain-containing protein [Pseudofrankia saprophytica]